jgi:hypothetical protein
MDNPTDIQVRAEIESSFADFVAFFFEAIIYLITGVELTEPDGSTNIVVDVIKTVASVIMPLFRGKWNRVIMSQSYYVVRVISDDYQAASL